MRINASLIRALNKLNLCPRQIKAQYIDRNIQFPTSDAMAAGTFFEQVCTLYCIDKSVEYMEVIRAKIKALNFNPNDIQATAELFHSVHSKAIYPNILQPPDSMFKKQTKKPKFGYDIWTVDLYRTYYQAYQFFNMLNAFKVEVLSIHHKMEQPFDKNDEIVIFGELDMDVLMELQDENQQRAIHNVIIDLKFTGNIHNEFGDYGWGQPHLLDHTQPKMYMKLGKLMNDDGTHPRFMYWVFDRKLKPEMKIIEIKYDSLEEHEINEAIRYTHDKLVTYALYDWPEVANADNCTKCPLKKDCKTYSAAPPLPKIMTV